MHFIFSSKSRKNYVCIYVKKTINAKLTTSPRAFVLVIYTKHLQI